MWTIPPQCGHVVKMSCVTVSAVGAVSRSEPEPSSDSCLSKSLSESLSEFLSEFLSTLFDIDFVFVFLFFLRQVFFFVLGKHQISRNAAGDFNQRGPLSFDKFRHVNIAAFNLITVVVVHLFVAVFVVVFRVSKHSL